MIKETYIEKVNLIRVSKSLAKIYDIILINAACSITSVF